MKKATKKGDKMKIKSAATQMVSVRLPREMVKWLNRMAKKQHRTRTDMIYRLLSEWMKEGEQDEKP